MEILFVPPTRGEALLKRYAKSNSVTLSHPAVSRIEARCSVVLAELGVFGAVLRDLGPFRDGAIAPTVDADLVTGFVEAPVYDPSLSSLDFFERIFTEFSPVFVDSLPDGLVTVHRFVLVWGEALTQ